MLILLETPQFLIIHKPAGLAVERQLHGYPSVEEWAWQYVGKSTRKPFVGIVHRLDRPVSGVLLLAKKRSALKVLNQQFADRIVEKVYHAIVERAPEADVGRLEHWLAKDPMGKRAIVSHEGAAGAALCRLDYRRLGERPQGTLLEVKPLQGRFHQIRAQLAAAGMPIAGDALYGAQLPFRPGAIALHAYSLRFRDTESGAWRTVTTAPDF